MSIDLVSAATSPFEAGPEQGPLLALAGSWAGPTKTWFDADGDPEVTHTVVVIEPILAGRIIRATYTGTAMGKPHAGMFLLTFDKAEGHYAMVWVDSFHMGTGLHFAPGKPLADGVSFLGSFPAGDERWGWRTSIRMIEGGVVLVEATNIMPDGTEMHAVETRLSRT